MCGAFRTDPGPPLTELSEALNTAELEGRGLRVPTHSIQVVANEDGQRSVLDATWWLLLDAQGKPNSRYATFNSRSAKLHTSALTKNLDRHSRCLIPATSFIEGQGGRYYQLERPGHAIAFGGLVRTIKVEGHTVRSASIITCPGNDQFADVHAKSVPLMLPADNKELIGDWLDSGVTQTDRFDAWLSGHLPHALDVRPIAGARKFDPIGPAFRVRADHPMVAAPGRHSMS